MTQGPVLIIAEAGVNHDGDADTAMALVDAAAEAGADLVKFQTFVPEALAAAGADKAPYQALRDGAGEGQLAMLRRLALDHAAHRRLLARCAERGIGLLSSPFDPASVAFLCDDLDLPLLKLGSGELTNAPLLLDVARRGRDLILSTGMADLEDIAVALGVLAFGYSAAADAVPARAAFATAFRSAQGRRALGRHVTLLHCTTAYPCPLEAVNLRAMDTLAERFRLPVGYSDHTRGIAVALAAAARGARVIEKHFTLDRSRPGPDHAASLEPAELAALVRGVREVEACLGSPEKALNPVERDNARVARKGLVAACTIRKGELFTAANLSVKRPAAGRPPMDYWELLGKAADRDYARDDVILA